MKKKFVFWMKITGDPVEDNFSTKPEYHAFFAECNKAFDFRVAKNPDSYLGKGYFKNVFRYKNFRFIPAEKRFKADVVYQRKRIADDSFDRAIPLLASPEFKKWCPDKWNQYQLLRDFMPKTFLIDSEEDYRRNLLNLKTEKAVIKPRRGEKGENVVIFNISNPAKLDKEILESKGYLLQEFGDTNVLVPGIVNEVHDIKLISIGKDLFANLRVPEKGKEFCTFDSPYTEISIKKLPHEVINLYARAKRLIDNKFPNQIYTVDIGITKKGPIIFELNSHTAFPYIHFDYSDKFFSALIKHIDSLK